MFGHSARINWEFPLSVYEIRAAVDSQLAHHRSRIAWWQEQRDTAQNQLKTDGVSFRSYDHSGGRGVQAVIDPTISARIGDCERSIKNHQEKIDEYEAYAFGLGLKGDGELLNMTPDDLKWAGFVGKETDDEEDE